MRMGVHKLQLAESLKVADHVLIYQPEGIEWDLQTVMAELAMPANLLHTIDDIVDLVQQNAHTGDHILVMSNGAFGGIHQKILDVL